MSDKPSSTSNGSFYDDVDVYQNCVELLKARGVKVVAFDMDQTAVSVHSRGRLRRDQLDDFLQKATIDFRNLVPLLHQHGFGLSIATHSDEAEFGMLIRPTSHILGSELARKLVERFFEPDIVSAFFIVAYNPRARSDGHEEENKIKRYHMRKLMEHFRVKPEEIILLDDTKDVVKDCTDTCGVQAILVDANRGFQAKDLLDNL